MSRILALGIALIAVSLPAPAMTVLYDFESEGQLKDWSLRTPDQDALSLDTAFASSGAHSLMFRSPKYVEGMQQWPAFEMRPNVKDWTKADRLVIDFVNPTGTLETFSIYITDSDTEFRKGAKSSVTVPAHSSVRHIIPLDGLPKHIDRADISLMHLFTTRPVADYVLHLDSVVLLAPGEEPPAYPRPFELQVVDMLRGSGEAGAVSDGLAGLAGFLADSGSLDEAARGWLEAELAREKKTFKTLQQEAASEDTGIDRFQDIQTELKAMQMRVDRLKSLAALMPRWNAETGISEYVAGFASSMQKVLPRDVPPSMEICGDLALDLARNETESMQVVVVPLTRDMKNVRVEVGELSSSVGGVLPKESTDVRVVGFVKTAQTPYVVDYTGWWPDPLLDFMNAADIARSDAQAFWVRVKAPKGATAGVYTGKGRIAADGVPAWEFDVSVRIRDFDMPDASPLPTAMSVYDSFPKKLAGADWPTMKLKWANYLADYYIDYDSLYRQNAPDWEILMHLEKQGRLVAFNLRYFSAHTFKPDLTEEQFQKALDAFMKDLRAIHAKATELGIIDKAYLYGFDECRPEAFPILQRICETVKKEFPDLLTLTTTYDITYGKASKVTAMGGWTPLTPSYRPERAEEVRKLGREVWWYICVGPRHPYANWFVEYPAIEARLLMGAMTAKYRPDGFLYYAITRWPVNKEPITSGPFTDWNPASFRDNNGDGSLLCAGEGGRPMATIRLENFLDGLEDYAYALELEGRIKRARDRWGYLTMAQREAVEKAEGALTVPESVVETMTTFTYDPEDVYAYRLGMAEAIEALTFAAKE